MNFPEHECGMYLEHNPHKDIYENIEDYIDDCDLTSYFVSEEDYNNSVSNDELWILQWYPDTPVGFYRVASSDLNLLMEYVNEQYPPVQD